MSWSYRKSITAGPFRINFSKSGISYSAGIRGARVNVGPRGTYVNLSAHGISYRRRIDGPAVPAYRHMPEVSPSNFEEVNNISSADIAQLTDTDSKEFVSELSQKAAQISYVNWFGIFPLIFFLAILMFTSFGSNRVVTQPVTDSILAKVTSDVGVYIRKSPEVRSVVLKTAAMGQSFVLLDTIATSKWLKVGFHDSVGYINSRFANIDHVHHDQVTADQPVLANPYAGYEFIAGIFGFIVLIRWLKKLDKKRFEMELHYDMDDQFRQVYELFSKHFATFSRSARIWQYHNSQQTGDWKRNAGAGTLIKRVGLRGISANQVPLRNFITNVSIPYIKLSNIELYFLPERMLVKRGGTFASVFYKNLQIKGHITRFIESEGVPGDAQVVGTTWRYVNKSGGPDRRFNDNRQIPICAYSEYALTSDTGIYEVITTSKQGAMDAFAEFLMQIGGLQSRMSIG